METNGIGCNNEKGLQEFRKTVAAINKVFLKTCEDQINDSEDCVLVPAVKSYLNHIQKALIKLDLDNEKLENKSLAEIGAYFDKVQSSIISKETQSTLNIGKRANSGNGSSTIDTANVESPAKKLKEQTNVGVSESSPGSEDSSIPENTNNTASTTEMDCLENVNNDDMSDTESEPPLPDSTVVVEQDAVYDIRCKVFVLTDGIYKEKGVGVLYIKSLLEGKLYQVLMRADGVLGNILLNARIIPNLPIKRASPKDLIVILATGTAKDEQNTFLIRVKDEGSGNELQKRLTILS